jgi:hypothetical protein
LWHASGGGQAKLPLGAQTPFEQASPSVQPSPSSHVVPSVTLGLLHTPEPGSQTPATWHWSAAAQVTGVPGRQVPPKQASACVQKLPSVQTAPSLLAGFEHTPVAASQLPTAWHWSDALQVTGFWPVHEPETQTSACVHLLPSSQLTPSALFGFEHKPVLVSQLPGAWHWSAAVHSTGFVPAQVPALQASVCVQALPSSHFAPVALFGFEQRPVALLHVPASWHWSSAVHVTGLAPVHTPA